MQYQIIENARLAPNVFLLDLAGDTSMIQAPGQFCQLQLPGLYLRRPISICDWDENGMTLIYKVVGQGTKALSQMETGAVLDALNGLGNGYDVSACGDHPLVIGGGVGTPPMYGLTRALLRAGKQPQVILGFNTYEEIFLLDEFEDLDVPVTVTTADGSHGIRGFVTDAMPEEYSYFYACGPEPMMRAVDRIAKTDGEFILEERMGCGFGACMGCSCRTRDGMKRICREGPVLRRGEILWEK